MNEARPEQPGPGWNCWTELQPGLAPSAGCSRSIMSFVQLSQYPRNCFRWPKVPTATAVP